MPLHPSWSEIALRLVLAVLAGAVVGYNREERSQAAGLRTTVLICLAAAVAMSLGNILMPTAGKRPDFFVQFDIMRLPLGLLSGIGFLGAGAIIKRDDIVVGVTTAATIWFMTVVGICLGAGQLVLGMSATAAAVAVLWALRAIDARLPRKLQATLAVRLERGRLSETELRELIEAEAYRVISWSVAYDSGGARVLARAEVSWTGTFAERPCEPEFLHALVGQPGVLEVDWSPRPVSG